MEQNHIESFARAVAKDILMDTDYLSVVEMLDDASVDYTDEEAQQIHDLVTRAKVII